MTTFILTAGTNTFAGAANVTDAFIAPAFGALTGVDTLSGGAGFGDVLILSSAPGAYLASHFAGVSGIEYIQTNNASLILPESLAATAETRQIFIESSGGSTIDASAFLATSGLNFSSDQGATGFDVAGGAGADVFSFSTAFAAADTFDGGGGTDLFSMNAIAAASFLFGANVSNIEQFSLNGDASATFGAGFNTPTGVAVVVASAGSHTLTVAAGGAVRLDARGGSGVDSFVSLAAGNQSDTFRFAAINLTAADTLRGGSGTGDLLVLSTGSGVNSVAAAALAGVREIETIELVGSNGSGVQIELPRSILASIAGNAITVSGSADGDTVDASSFVVGERLLASGLGGNDIISGGQGIDVLQGGLGDDEIEGGAGGDTLNGGVGGADVLSYRSSAAAVAIDLGLGTAGGAGSDAVGDGFVDFENIRGSAFADMLTGNSGANALFGLGGNDTLIGAAGADRLEGGSGNDIYGIDSALDAVVEALDGGYDTINTSLLAYTLGADVERVNYTGSGNFTGKGNALANRLNGNAGNDRFIVDTGGADIFSGGGGSDSLDFRAGPAAVLNFIANIHDGAALGDTFASVEKFFGSNTAGDTMTAGAGRANFSGFGGNDTLTGGANIDTLSGGDGDDTINGGANIDTIQGGRSNDALTGGAGRDYFLYVETAASGGWGADTVTDFQDGLDLIKIDSPGVATSIAGFTITGNGTANVLLTLNALPSSTITLNAPSAITISASDFLFY